MPTTPLITAIVTLTVALATASCAGGGDSSRPSSGEQPSEATPSSSATAALVQNGDIIDIGGRDLYLYCWGEPVPTEPTVLLVSGQGPPLQYWSVMAEGFAAEGHHVCAYDRAGVGSSDTPPKGPRTMQDQVADLVAMLEAVNLNEPLVMVAHSLGSLPALGLAAHSPQRVSGLVFVDPWAPRVGATLRAALPPEGPNESPALAEERQFHTVFPYDPTQNSEHVLVSASDEEGVALLDDPGPLFGDRPVVVLQAPFPPRPAGLPRSYDEVARAAWTDGNRELAAESTRGSVIKVEDTGHNIQEDQPEAVMDAIRAVMRDARR